MSSRRQPSSRRPTGRHTCGRTRACPGRVGTWNWSTSHPQPAIEPTWSAGLPWRRRTLRRTRPTCSSPAWVRSAWAGSLRPATDRSCPSCVAPAMILAGESARRSQWHSRRGVTSMPMRSPARWSAGRTARPSKDGPRWPRSASRDSFAIGKRTIARTLAILDRLTASVRDAVNGRADDVRVLRQALGYGWSVAAAADITIGLPALGRWLSDPNVDVRWIVRQNLTKARLAKVAPDWIERARAALA